MNWGKLFLIALRIAIGWHFLYEGLFKLQSDTGAVAYAPARYTLQTATARLRASDATPACIDAWHDEIARYFAVPRALSEDQKARLAALRDRLKLEPELATSLDWHYVHQEILKLTDEPPPPRFSSVPFLQASAGPFRPAFRALVDDADGVERLTPASVAKRIDARYIQILGHFEEAGKAFTVDQRKRLADARDRIKQSAGAILTEPGLASRIRDYRAMVRRVAAAGEDTPFSAERRDADRKKVDALQAELLAFANEPLSELATQAQAIATVDQLGAGPIPHPAVPGEWIDAAVTWALLLIGVFLMLGRFTRAAAIAAAAQLALFYFASPPWPGLPAMTTGGHYLIVDRNLIEGIAALAAAFVSKEAQS